MLGKDSDSKPSCSEEIQLSRQEDSESHAPGSAQGCHRCGNAARERSWGSIQSQQVVILEYEVYWGLGETLSASLLSVRTGVSSCHEEGQCRWLHSGRYGLLLPKLHVSHGPSKASKSEKTLA